MNYGPLETNKIPPNRRPILKLIDSNRGQFIQSSFFIGSFFPDECFIQNPLCRPPSCSIRLQLLFKTQFFRKALKVRPKTFGNVAKARHRSESIRFVQLMNIRDGDFDVNLKVTLSRLMENLLCLFGRIIFLLLGTFCLFQKHCASRFLRPRLPS